MITAFPPAGSALLPPTAFGIMEMSLSAKPLFLSLVLGALMISGASAQVKVGVVTSSTGPVAAVGIPQKNSVALLPTTIGGETVEYISLDDASDPTAAANAFKKLINEEKVDAIIGPSGSPSAMGVIGFAAESGTPMLAPVGTAAVVLPMDEKKKWVFKTTQNDNLVSEKVVADMVKRGYKTVGFIATADAFGDNWEKVFKADAEKAGLKVVGAERFQRQDNSLTAQGLKLLSENPDAILIAAPGSSSVLPATTMVDLGYAGQLYETHGAALPAFLQLGGKKVEGVRLAASLMLVLDEAPDSEVAKPVAVKYVADYEKAFGTKPATFGANVYDAGLLLEVAIPVALKTGAKPGTPEFRAALRDALENVKELAGTQGVYNMTPADHSGFDQRGMMLIVVKDGAFHLAE